MNDVFQYTVCTRCFTYNQGEFILDTLRGFVTQETDFPVVSVIVDDASTDSAPQIILDFFRRNFNIQDSAIAYQENNDYGEVLYAQHKDNKNCFFAILLLKENHYSRNISKIPYLSRWVDRSKYIAMCEGDDFWTDPMKLKTQVDFLDRNRNYSLCCHRYKIYNQISDTWENDYVKSWFDVHPEGFSFSRTDNLKTWITKTMTLMYRREWVDEKEMQKFRYRCDEHLNYLLLSRGPGYCFPFVGAVYRRTDTGVFAPLPEKAKRMRGILIRSELLAHNLKDNDLKEDVFRRIKKYLNKDCSLKGMIGPIGICLKSCYLTGGLISSLRMAKKMLGSFIKGAFAKHRVNVS